MKRGTAIEMEGLTKDFPCGLRGGVIRAVDRLSLRIEAGQIYGLIGPNGSGKSTAIRMALDLVSATSGECRIFGVSSLDPEARRRVGYLSESPSFPPFLSGRELVAYYGGLCGLAGAGLRGRVDAAIRGTGLADAADRPVGGYSKGMRQRVGLAQALVHNPELVILDEPSDGLDPVGANELKGLLLALKGKGVTVVIVSHLLSDMDAICDRVAILDRGRLVLESATASLFPARLNDIFLRAVSAPGLAPAAA